MGYIEALKAAGAEVHSHASFGDWSGTTHAHVTYRGVSGVVSMAFGSCSACDNYQATFACDDPTPDRLAAFGRDCLGHIRPPAEALEAARKDAEWDLDAEAAVDWLEALAR